MDACRKTKEHDLPLLWVDTNCIDKSSSAELSEAINSMFIWYSLAHICFAYLSDVDKPADPKDSFEFAETRAQISKQFSNSRWFTRGWTLQELLAPKTLQFFSSGWTKLGSRNPSSELEANHIKSLVTDITGIAGKYLEGNGNLHTATVATRMSWAARRQTSRPEDMAYSLLGIFDINMPLLYGEGEKAYIRLQEEIIKISTDQSIFAWEFMPEMTWAQPYEQAPKPQLSWVSLLAPRPICFRNSIFTRVRKSAGFGVASEIYSMTNVGLSIHLPLLTTTSPKRFFGVLQCYNRGSGVHQDMLLCVPLQKFKDTFIRTTWPPVPLPLCWSSRTPPPIPLHVPRYQRLNHEELRECFRIPTFDVSTTHLILFTTTMADLNLRAWSTTAQSTLLSVHSLLISRTVPRTAPVPRTGVKVLEGGGLSFSPTGETAAFTAMVAIDSDDRSFASSGQLGGATWCRLCDTESELASGKAFEEQTLGSLNQQTMNDLLSESVAVGIPVSQGLLLGTHGIESDSGRLHMSLQVMEHRTTKGFLRSGVELYSILIFPASQGMADPATLVISGS